ncbi:MAG: hypothetical protein HY711_04140, partial [Candidatus Melainabacteria bacterium]|nr:hypothetical protein [Candidatus Melainabacteria bacterium]
MSNKLFSSRHLVPLLLVVFLLSTTPVNAHCEGDESIEACSEATSQTMQCQTTEGVGSTCQAVQNSMSLDLSSQTTSVHVGEDLVSAITQATINLAGTPKAVNVGDHLTPAEFVALQQILAGGTQTLLLDAAGRAVGGTFSLGSVPAEQLSSLVIPSGVVALSQLGSLNITGSLLTQGMLLGLPDTSTNTVNIQAGLVNVASGGSITTEIPTSLASLFSLTTTPVSLTLYSLSDVINAGSITASGVLNVSALGSIINQLPAGVVPGTPAPVMAGALGTNLITGSGSIVNSGVISSALGNTTFNTAQATDLVFNNIAGQVLASQGVINVRDALYSAKTLTQLTGGLFDASAINLNGGDGLVKTSVDEFAGVVNVKAGEAHIGTARGDLSVGVMEITGDPTVANSGGNVNFATNQNFAAPLAVITPFDVTRSDGVTSITAQSIDIAAGMSFAPGTGGVQVVDNVTNFVLSGESASGGQIRLPGVLLTATNGGITLVAARGSAPAIGSDSGKINVGGLNSSSVGGVAGPITIIGENTISIGTGGVDARGVGGGAVDIRAADPGLGAGVSYLNGVRAGNYVAGGALARAIVIDGNILTAGVNGAGGNGGLVNVDTRADINILGLINTNGGPGFNGGAVTLTSAAGTDGGLINVGGAIDTSGGNSATNGGNGGAITVNTAARFLAGSNLISKGGNSTVAGAGGIGGNITLQTFTAPAVGGFTNNYRVGSIEVLGFIQSVGGNATNGNGGNGGTLTVRTGTLQVYNVIPTTADSIAASGGTTGGGGAAGVNGTVNINTYGTQDLPDPFNFISTTANITALPGGLFSVGNSSVNGTAGNIVSSGIGGNFSATAGTAGRVAGITSTTPASSPFNNGSITITVTGSTFNIDRTTIPKTVDVDVNGTGTRTLVTPGEALALFQVSRGYVQTIGIDAQGRATDVNPNTLSAPSIITLHGFEFYMVPTQAINIQVMNTAGGADDLNITIPGLYVTLAAAWVPSINIDANITFSSANADLAILFGSNNFTFAANRSIVIDPTAELELSGSGTVWNVSGNISGNGIITLEHFTNPLTINLGGQIVGTILGNAPGQAVTITGGQIGGTLTADPTAMSSLASITINSAVVGGGTFTLGKLGTTGALSITMAAGNLNVLGAPDTIQAGGALSLVATTGTLSFAANSTLISGGLMTLSDQTGITVGGTTTLTPGGGLTISASAGLVTVNAIGGANLISAAGPINITASAAVTIGRNLTSTSGGIALTSTGSNVNLGNSLQYIATGTLVFKAFLSLFSFGTPVFTSSGSGGIQLSAGNGAYSDIAAYLASRGSFTAPQLAPGTNEIQDTNSWGTAVVLVSNGSTLGKVERNPAAGAPAEVNIGSSTINITNGAFIVDRQPGGIITIQNAIFTMVAPGPVNPPAPIDTPILLLECVCAIQVVEIHTDPIVLPTDQNQGTTGNTLKNTVAQTQAIDTAPLTTSTITTTIQNSDLLSNQAIAGGTTYETDLVAEVKKEGCVVVSTGAVEEDSGPKVASSGGADKSSQGSDKGSGGGKGGDSAGGAGGKGEGGQDLAGGKGEKGDKGSDAGPQIALGGKDKGDGGGGTSGVTSSGDDAAGITEGKGKGEGGAGLGGETGGGGGAAGGDIWRGDQGGEVGGSGGDGGGAVGDRGRGSDGGGVGLGKGEGGGAGGETGGGGGAVGDRGRGSDGGGVGLGKGEGGGAGGETGGGGGAVGDRGRGSDGGGVGLGKGEGGGAGGET